MRKMFSIIIILTTTVILCSGVSIQANKRHYSFVNDATFLIVSDTSKPLSLTVNNFFQSNMVLQRDKSNQIWGTAAPGVEVIVNASWRKKVLKAKTDSKGKWVVSIAGTPANALPQTITISDHEHNMIQLENILIGDVWIASGQSNMVMPMPYANVFLVGTVNYKEEIAKANHPNLRYIAMQMNRQDKPLSNYNDTSKWSVCTPDAAEHYNGIGYSAIGYYFGKKLDSALNIPIGIIVSAVGATGCQEWTGKETIEADPILSYYKPFNPSNLYNGMIYPLRNLAVKGFIWDQGESNEYDSPVNNYTVLHSAMITEWRKLFNQGNLPFYFVQMTPTQFNKGTDNFYAFFREAQANVLRIKKTGMAVTIDDPEINNIHFTLKAPAADRLARLAMRCDYGLNVAANGPSYKSFTQKGSTVTISFNNAAGLKTIGLLSQVFIVAGEDRIFYNANAIINGNNIVITVPPTVGTVKSIRYAFTNTAIGSLYNSDNLPMEPFRTDSW